MSIAEALYEPDGDLYAPTIATTGPWDPRAQHGGPPAALLTWAVEQVASDEPMQLARLTFDLLRPVPLTPLSIRTEVTRPGRKVSVVEATLCSGDTAVVRVSALKVREADLAVPAGARPDDPPPPGPETGELAYALGIPEGFNNEGCEIRFVEGGFQHAAPGTAWARLKVPVVAGQPTSPAMRAAAAADLGNGVSSVLRQAEWLFINPDLSIHLSRMPVGDWVCLRAITHPGDTGVGFAESALYDIEGRVGRSVQSLLLDRQRAR